MNLLAAHIAQLKAKAAQDAGKEKRKLNAGFIFNLIDQSTPIKKPRL